MRLSRRHFVVTLALLLGRPSRVRAAYGPLKPKHPEPRPGITAARVLRDDMLTDPSLAPVFAMVREIPQIADGIRCNCGCAEMEGFYSLLSCYEKDGMAQHCVICQGQAKLAYKLHAEGWSLRGIRRAIDAEFGD
ncbi:MAG: PCYCGC motif-containing (lipo)protein [Gemmatimonadaceae bacterium]